MNSQKNSSSSLISLTFSSNQNAWMDWSQVNSVKSVINMVTSDAQRFIVLLSDNSAPSILFQMKRSLSHSQNKGISNGSRLLPIVHKNAEGSELPQQPKKKMRFRYWFLQITMIISGSLLPVVESSSSQPTKYQNSLVQRKALLLWIF